jgi:copper transport protein
VFAIAASAVPQVLAGVASIDALVTTAYGRLVCAKFALLLLALAFALSSRRRIAAGARAVVPTVRLELLVLAAVLAVTAVLVESPQPRELASAATPARIAEASFTAGDVAVTVTTSGSGERARTIDIRLTRAGTPANADAVTATIGEARTGTGPLTIPVRATAPGTYRADTTLPFAGTWHARISVRNGPFDEGHTTLDL